MAQAVGIDLIDNQGVRSTSDSKVMCEISTGRGYKLRKEANNFHTVCEWLNSGFYIRKFW